MILRYSRLKDNKDDWAPSLMLHPDLKFCNSKSDLIYSLQPKWKSSIQLAKIRLEADCASDDELLIANFRLKFKKVGKTTGPFRYDPSQIPYTVEVTKRFKGLDLIERLKNYGWRFMTLYRGQGSRPSPRKRNAEK